MGALAGLISAVRRAARGPFHGLSPQQAGHVLRKALRGHLQGGALGPADGGGVHGASSHTQDRFAKLWHQEGE